MPGYCEGVRVLAQAASDTTNMLSDDSDISRTFALIGFIPFRALAKGASVNKSEAISSGAF